MEFNTDTIMALSALGILFTTVMLAWNQDHIRDLIQRNRK